MNILCIDHAKEKTNNFVLTQLFSEKMIGAMAIMFRTQVSLKNC